MKIETLNEKEDAVVKKYAKANRKAMLKAIKSKEPKKAMEKSMRKIGKSLVKECLKLGLGWLRGAFPK